MGQFINKKTMLGLSAVAGVGLMISYMNATPVKVSSSSRAPASIVSSTERIASEPNGTLTYSAVIQPEQAKLVDQPVDVVWIVDNADPKKKVAPIIRKNLKKFMDSVNNRSDVRVLVVTQVGNSGTKYSIPVKKGRHEMVDQTVGTNAAVGRLVDGLCPEHRDDRKGACKDLTLGVHRPVSGKIMKFLRKDSKKIFVLIGTNDGHFITHPLLAKLLAEALPGEKPVVHAFSSNGKKHGTCAPGIGQNLRQMTAMTSGVTFDLCAQDWSSTFAKIAPKAKALQSKTLPIPAEIQANKIKTVVVNGVMVSPKLYQINRDGLVLDPTLVEANRPSTLLINYKK